jgi:hypothetical protein
LLQYLFRVWGFPHVITISPLCNGPSPVYSHLLIHHPTPVRVRVFTNQHGTRANLIFSSPHLPLGCRQPQPPTPPPPLLPSLPPATHNLPGRATPPVGPALLPRHRPSSTPAAGVLLCPLPLLACKGILPQALLPRLQIRPPAAAVAVVLPPPASASRPPPRIPRCAATPRPAGPARLSLRRHPPGLRCSASSASRSPATRASSNTSSATSPPLPFLAPAFLSSARSLPLPLPPPPARRGSRGKFQASSGVVLAGVRSPGTARRRHLGVGGGTFALLPRAEARIAGFRHGLARIEEARRWARLVGFPPAVILVVASLLSETRGWGAPVLASG